MKITIPICIQSLTDRYRVTPLFVAGPRAEHEKLERALHLLARDLREELRRLGRLERHDELAAYTFNPDLDYHRLDVAVELRKRVARCRFLFVAFESMGRRLAFTPSVADLWFDVARGERLEDRATEVLTQHFRQRERDDEDEFVPPEKLALTGAAWVSSLDLHVYPAKAHGEDVDATRAALGAVGQMDGDTELRRIGRCLNQLYPDDLDRVRLRDRELEELTRLLTASDRRPVLLLGPRLVGKTALLHEYVFRTVAARKDPYHPKGNVWLLAPQRLISGMSYVGQWENRLLAILKVAEKQQHILYFDDLLGLYQAGQTSQSDLSAAQVLKPYVEKRTVRFLAEITAEAFRVLRERDRGFADLFHVLPIKEPSEDETLRILYWQSTATGGSARLSVRAGRAAGGARPAAASRARPGVPGQGGPVPAPSRR
jgi:hypothetical protein